MASPPLLVLPRDDAEYFIERMVAAQIIPPGHYCTRPLTRGQVASALTKIEQSLTVDSTLLSSEEKSALRLLERRFAPEMREQRGGIKSQSSFFHWSDTTGSSMEINLFLFQTAKIDDSTGSSGYILTPGYGGRIWGKYRDAAGFLVTDRLAGDFSNVDRFKYNFNPSRGQFTMVEPDKRADSIMTDKQTYERYSAWISASVKKINILAGTDAPVWGPEGLSLSGNAPPFAQVRLSAEMGRMQYTYFHGNLAGAHDSLLHLITVNEPLRKYLVGQRIDLVLPHHLNVGWNAVTVYGDRPVELIYLVPVTPLFFAGHFLGDRDNTTMQFDAVWNPFKNMQFSGELFLDDLLSPTDFFTDYWGNKWAFSIGAGYFPLCLGKMWRTGIKYTRIEPWVYTHYEGEVLRYRHFGACLGSPLGPNSDQLAIDAECRLNAASIIKTGFRHIRHGGNRGSNIDDIHLDSDGTTKLFMGGVVESENKISIEAGLRFREALTGQLAYSYSDFENWKNISGESHGENTIEMSLSLDW